MASRVWGVVGKHGELWTAESRRGALAASTGAFLHDAVS